jgi:hypothetical protein
MAVAERNRGNAHEAVVGRRQFQITIDALNPDREARFWATALGYELEGPPDGFDRWSAYWRSVGVPESEANDEYDSIVDPCGHGPRIWFQRVEDPKRIKNRLHLDITVSGGRDVPITTRRQRVQAEAQRLVAAGATFGRALTADGVDHYAVAMFDPEGNEFDIN